jgi:hypothetical protein
MAVIVVCMQTSARDQGRAAGADSVPAGNERQSGEARWYVPCLWFVLSLPTISPLCVLLFVGILPRVNHIMMSIKGRKWRDLVIMGGFISICICALLLYWLSYRK